MEFSKLVENVTTLGPPMDISSEIIGWSVKPTTHLHLRIPKLMTELHLYGEVGFRVLG
jgi:hypothetical protein